MTVWLQLFDSCTGCQSLSGSSTSCACWFTSRFWDTPEYISDLMTSVANIPGRSTLRASSYGNLVVPWHVGKLATEPFLLLHREHGTGYRWSWNCCDRRTCFVVIWKHLCFILSTGTRIRIDSVMRPQSSSKGRNTSASVTVIMLCVCMTASFLSDVSRSHLPHSDLNTLRGLRYWFTQTARAYPPS